MALSVRDDAFLRRLLQYSPEPRYVQVSLQLFGMPGHGKSSLINTCLHIVHGGSFKNIAGSGKSNHPITMDRKDHRLTDKVLITDNRGVNKMSLEEQEEIAAQMSQLRGRDRVEWDRSLRQKLNLIPEQFRNRPMEIIVPVFVYSTESLLTDERYEEIEPFIRGAHNITASCSLLASLVAIILHRLQLHRIVSKMAQDPQDIRRRINQFTTGNVLGYNRVALQVFGMLGHGKSSLINSSVCVVKDEEYQNVAGAGQSQGGITTSRHEHELTDALVMIDNRGFQKLAWKEIVEACAQLCSLRDIGEVSWKKDNLEVTLGQLPQKYTDRPRDLILPVLVYSAMFFLTADDTANMERLITNSFNITGIHPIVVITKCSADKVEEVKNKFGNLGAMKRICLENYTENNYERTEEKDRNILEFVNMCIQEAERVLKMRQNEDPQTRFITQATQQVERESEILREEKKTVNGSDKKSGCKPS